jgi:hypothetical protein
MKVTATGQKPAKTKITYVCCETVARGKGVPVTKLRYVACACLLLLQRKLGFVRSRHEQPVTTVALYRCPIIGLMYIFIFLQIMMYRSKEERTEIIPVIGNGSQREAAAIFNRLHPDREPITQTCCKV